MIAIVVLLVLLGIADIATTLKGLRAGDTEANPVAGFVFRLLGPVPGMILLKVLCTVIIVAVIEISGWWWLGLIFLALYLAVLWNNWRVLNATD